jgi:hypothetical protein
VANSDLCRRRRLSRPLALMNRRSVG